MSRLSIYEINTAVWLGGHSLADVPARRWDAIAALPVDAVWLMGVWERRPAGLEIALDEPVLVGVPAALGELRPSDVIGSPYCVRDYVVDERFGGRGGAGGRARASSAARGLRLILDYVPNHVAPDHPWVRRTRSTSSGHRGGAGERSARLRAHGGGIVARGRDPYFPPWPDVVQLNAFSPGCASAVAETLVDVGAQCDGLRCDMAMLMTNEVFARTWGLPAPAEEFWPALIARVKWTHPGPACSSPRPTGTWSATLQQQGFDYCYDKRLYDRLAHEDADVGARAICRPTCAYQEQLRALHREPRRAARGRRCSAPAQARAAAVVMSTLPGARLYHDGQLDGRPRRSIPVFLGRAPEEPPDAELRAFYSGCCPRRGAERRVAAVQTENRARVGVGAHLVVVNLTDAGAGRGGAPWTGDVTLEPTCSGRARTRRGPVGSAALGRTPLPLGQRLAAAALVHADKDARGAAGSGERLSAGSYEARDRDRPSREDERGAGSPVPRRGARVLDEPRAGARRGARPRRDLPRHDRAGRPDREGALRDRRVRRVRASRRSRRCATAGGPARSATARSSCSTSSRSSASAPARPTTPPSPRWVPA